MTGLHFTLATLAHDIGYVRGICRNDRPGKYIIDASGKTVSSPRGASGAFLTHCHVERSKIIQERFGDHPFETGLREKVRGFIEAMIRSELDAVLARPRYARQRTGAPEVDPPTSARLP